MQTASKIETERFWSKASAERNAAKLRKLGYQAEVAYLLYCDGRSDWSVRCETNA